MRKLFAIAGLFALLQLSIGCKHTGGECDCAPVPGDSVGHNPHVTYHAGNPVISTAPATKTGAAEPIAAPKSMPK